MPIAVSFALINIKKLNENLHAVYAVAQTEYRLEVLLRTINMIKQPAHFQQDSDNCEVLTL
jgi:hypothetical protein